MYPLNQGWREVPCSDQKGVLIPSRQKMTVRINANGKEIKKKKPHRFQFELLPCVFFVFLSISNFSFADNSIKNFYNQSPRYANQLIKEFLLKLEDFEKSMPT